jgi:hypothetical protein
MLKKPTTSCVTTPAAAYLLIIIARPDRLATEAHDRHGRESWLGPEQGRPPERLHHRLPRPQAAPHIYVPVGRRRCSPSRLHWWRFRRCWRRAGHPMRHQGGRLLRRRSRGRAWGSWPTANISARDRGRNAAKTAERRASSQSDIERSNQLSLAPRPLRRVHCVSSKSERPGT